MNPDDEDEDRAGRVTFQPIDYTDDIQVFDLQVDPVKQGESVTLTGKVDMGDLVPAFKQLGQGYRRLGIAAEDFQASLEDFQGARRPHEAPPDWAMDAFVEEIQQAASVLGPGYRVEVEQHQDVERLQDEFFAILHTPRGSVSQEVTRYDFRDAFRKLGVIE